MPFKSPEFSREFKLAVACCRWPPSEARNEAIRAVANADIDWDRFSRVVARQRIWGLAHNGLTEAGVEAPSLVALALAGGAASFARQNAGFLAEAVRLRDLFVQSGITATFFKGSTLAVLAYGGGRLKHGRDVDVLVPLKSVQAGILLLQAAGYFPRHPLPGSPELFTQWLQTAKDFEFFNPRLKTTVELHWALVENAVHAAALADNMRTRLVDVGNGESLPTLESNVLFVYLCVHGARHGWFRLKWLADLAALLSHASKAELEACIDLAKRCDMEPCVAQAVLLCDQLFGLDSVADIAAHYRRNLRYRWLERVALNAMTSGGGEVELQNVPFGTFPMLVSDFFLGKRWAYLMAEARLRLVSLRDMQSVALPRPLWFLYPFLRMPLALARRLQDRGRGFGG